MNDRKADEAASLYFAATAPQGHRQCAVRFKENLSCEDMYVLVKVPRAEDWNAVHFDLGAADAPGTIGLAIGDLNGGHPAAGRNALGEEIRFALRTQKLPRSEAWDFLCAGGIHGKGHQEQKRPRNQLFHLYILLECAANATDGASPWVKAVCVVARLNYSEARRENELSENLCGKFTHVNEKAAMLK